MLNNLTSEEIINRFKNSDDENVLLLVSCLEREIDSSEEYVQLIENNAVQWATSCFRRNAGEDHHGDVISLLNRALIMNKKEMQEQILLAIEILSMMDQAAGNELEAMNNDGIY